VATVALSGFTLHSVSRSSNATRRGYGGVAVYVRDTLAPYTQLVRRDSEEPGCELIWLRFALADEGSLLLGACYLAPETSKVYVDKGTTAATKDRLADMVFGKIQSTISELALGGESVLIAGDMNARTAGVSDVPELEQVEALREHFGTSIGGADPAALAALPARCNRDKAKNTFGVHLGAFCRSTGMAILNGRIQGDRQGALTFPHEDGGGSTIDLFVATASLFPKCTTLKVGKARHLSPATLVSDHLPVSLVLDVLVGGCQGPQRPPPGQKRVAFDVKRWQQYASLFADDRSPTMSAVVALVQGISDGVPGKDRVTSAVDKLGRVLDKALRTAFSQQKDTSGSDDGLAPWWNAACAAAQASKARARAALQGRSKEGPAWESFCAARSAYNLAKKHAKAALREQEMRDFVSTCRNDRRTLWRKLGDVARECCPVTDGDVWVEHFRNLLNTGAGEFSWERVHTILNQITDPDFVVEPGCGLDVWRTARRVDERRQQADALINQPITLAEVERALKALPNGKASGVEKACGECYKYARRQSVSEVGRVSWSNVLAPPLLALFEHIRITGEFPEQFSTTVLSPVYKKKGSPLECGNYRGIAVGGALAKCYASILLRRLITACQELKLRSFTQAGFRAGYGTTHHLFVKRHLAAKHEKKGAPPLIVVQIDYQKAFDFVVRPVLWERMRERGFGGPPGNESLMMRALLAAYEKVTMRVKVNGKLGGSFESTQGVKQGDPLSTELFGLFIETLADMIDHRDATIDNPFLSSAPHVDSVPFSCFFYADDQSLVATSAKRMRFLLRAVDDFCRAFGMKVNVSKCECMIFAHRQSVADKIASDCQHPINGLKLSGQLIPLVPTARYLGLVYGPERPFDSCRIPLNDSGRAAMYGLMGKLRRLKLWAPDVRMHCFDTQVRSVLSYGCEVWGPDALSDMMNTKRSDSGNVAEGLFEGCLSDPAVKLQVSFMRSVCGAARPSQRLLFAELSQLPLHYHWASRVCGFWNQLVRQGESPAYHVLRDEVRASIEGDHGGWAGKYLRFLTAIGVSVWDGLPPGSSVTERVDWLTKRQLPCAHILTQFRSCLMGAWQHERLVSPPDACPSDSLRPGIHMSKFKHWFGLPFQGAAAVQWGPHAKCSMPRACHKKLMRFRLCCWPLHANRPVVNGVRVPRNERTCRMCATETDKRVEHEMHVVLECPAYDALRSKHGIDVGGGMLSVMCDTDQHALARFLADVWQTRDSRFPFSS
jgi:exonuclease III